MVMKTFLLFLALESHRGLKLDVDAFQPRSAPGRPRPTPLRTSIDDNETNEHQNEQENPDTSEQQALSKLLGVCSNLQDPRFFDDVAKWAHKSGWKPKKKSLIATQPVERGDVLSLYPIHALGIQHYPHHSNTDENGDDEKSDREHAFDNQGKDFIVFDSNISHNIDNGNGDDNNGDGDDYFTTSKTIMSPYRLKLNLLDDPYYNVFDTIRDDIFLDVSLNRPVKAGWMGHLARVAPVDESKDGTETFMSPKGFESSSTTKKSKNKDKNHKKSSNCLVLPLPGAAPLCALVAKQNIKKGQILIRDTSAEENWKDNKTFQACLDAMVQRYNDQISSLATYTDMAYQYVTSLPTDRIEVQEEENSDDNNSDGKIETQSTFKYPFYPINYDFPGITELRSDPDIYTVDNFLSADECHRLIDKARPHLIPCLAKNEVTGMVEQDPSRTSMNANVPRKEVPTVVKKIQNLMKLDDVNRLEILQVLRYVDGQEFLPHTDGFDGPITACGFENSGRLVTLFCYLNTVAADAIGGGGNGGATRFNQLGLDIQPKQGMAVVHFPNTVGLEEDIRTEHQGMPSKDEKWLLVTWIWKDSIVDEQYSEDRLPSLSEDII